ncbi:MAG: GTPase ObgE [Oscillospiraceae bacterium]|nr:GTPase ObgE [Oscillospiraceae bacterium]
MFIDSAKIFLKAGNGGDGRVSFRREKYVPAGGPDGGDGGRGGDVVFVGDSGMHTLRDFRYKRNYRAQDGADGEPRNCTGKSGEDLRIRAPLGTIVFDADSGDILCDITENGQTAIVVKGGKGGAGNQHFATSTKQAPDFAKSGVEGEERYINVELKLIADVGLIGFPNVGKSTLLSVVTSARPQIANYHFTTLTPNLGVVELGDDEGFVMADIPGLIEGASAGAGLGDEFLRHIERTRLLLHVVDVAGTEGRDPVSDFEIINRELRDYKIDLSDKPQIVVANKTDALYDGNSGFGEFKIEMEKRGFPVIGISAVTGKGVREMLQEVWMKLKELPADVPNLTSNVPNLASDVPNLTSNESNLTSDELIMTSGDYMRRQVGCEEGKEQAFSESEGSNKADSRGGEYVEYTLNERGESVIRNIDRESFTRYIESETATRIDRNETVIRKISGLSKDRSGIDQRKERNTVNGGAEKRVARFEVNLENGVFLVSGHWVKRLISDINFNNSESMQFFQRQLIRFGVIEALERKGICEGDTVRIYDLEFDYMK